MVKAGLLLMSSRWFKDVGIGDPDNIRYKGLQENLDHDVRAILDTLVEHFDIVFPGVVDEVPAAEKALDAFLNEQVELVIVAHQTWSDDIPFVHVLRGIKHLPILLWCYHPQETTAEHMASADLYRTCGSVGILQGSAPMKRMGISFEFLFGNPGNETLKRELSEYSKAFEIKSSLKHLRIGMIGERCEFMTGNYLDEAMLLYRLGIKMVPISVAKMARVADSIPDDEVGAFAKEMKGGAVSCEVSDNALHHAARASLALAKLVSLESLDIIAMDDLNVEMHEYLKTRPCLWPAELSSKNIVIGMEADVINTLGMWINKQFSGSMPMFTEAYTFDQKRNALVMGHPGAHDAISLSSGGYWLVPDMEYEMTDETEGVWQCFDAKAGEVTVSSFFADETNYRMLVANGQALDAHKKLDGFPTAFVKLDAPVERFYETAVKNGLTQHFSVTYGHTEGGLQKLCKLIGAEYVYIDK